MCVKLDYGLCLTRGRKCSSKICISKETCTKNIQDRCNSDKRPNTCKSLRRESRDEQMDVCSSVEKNGLKNPDGKIVDIVSHINKNDMIDSTQKRYLLPDKTDFRSERQMIDKCKDEKIYAADVIDLNKDETENENMANVDVSVQNCSDGLIEAKKMKMIQSTDVDDCVEHVNCELIEVKEMMRSLKEKAGFPVERPKLLELLDCFNKVKYRKKQKNSNRFQKRKTKPNKTTHSRKPIQRSFNTVRNIRNQRTNFQDVKFMHFPKTIDLGNVNFFFKHKKYDLKSLKCLLQQEKKRKNDRKTKIPKLQNELCDILFQWRSRPDMHLTAYPLQGQGLNSYFQTLNIENQNERAGNAMNYEWNRFASFASYPDTVPVRPIHLAAAGFYYTNTSDEVRCFSCGVTHRDWIVGDDAMNVHRRISPDCNYVLRNDSTNVAVTNNHRDVNVTSARHPGEASNQGLNSDLSDPHQQSEIQSRNNIETNSVNNASSENDEAIDATPTQTESATTNEHSTMQANDHRAQQTVQRPVRRNNNDRKEVVGGLDTLGINFDKPKYPAFAVLTVRISTFQKWPSYLSQTPREMALAGFMYTGEADHCRCFFCGGGLRHWEDGDDPWVEHARWFPKCYFLRQNKGDAFVSLVLQRQADLENQAELGAAAGNHVSGGEEYSKTRNCTENEDLSKTGTMEKTDEDQLRLPAALSVMEMGYTRAQVTQAIRCLQNNNDRRPLKATDILKTIFSLESEEVLETEVDQDLMKQLGEEDMEILKENKRLKEQKYCRICKDEEASIVFLPCGHMACCGDCAPAMRNCPVCKEFVRGTVKTWLV